MRLGSHLASSGTSGVVVIVLAVIIAIGPFSR